MRYSKIPFVSSPLMSGLAPLVPKRRMRPRPYISGFGPQYPNSSMLGSASMSKFFGEEAASNDNGLINALDPLFRNRSTKPFGLGHISLSKFFGEESANNDNGLTNDLDPLFRNKSPMPYALGGLGAALPAGTSAKVMLRPQPGAPPGFPGFFAWLKSEQPAMWNYAKVALPAHLTQAEGHRTGGATLMGAYMSGLGDDTTDTSDTSAMIFSSPTIDVPLPTVNIPDTSAETATSANPPNPGPGAVAQIVSTLAQAAPSILSTVNQQTLFNTQLSRAKAGLPPLNTSSFGLTTALSSASLLPIGLGLAAVVGFMMLRKRR